jgi:hypothetical protein
MVLQQKIHTILDLFEFSDLNGVNYEKNVVGFTVDRVFVMLKHEKGCPTFYNFEMW